MFVWNFFKFISFWSPVALNHKNSFLHCKLFLSRSTTKWWRSTVKKRCKPAPEELEKKLYSCPSYAAIFARKLCFSLAPATKVVFRGLQNVAKKKKNRDDKQVKCSFCCEILQASHWKPQFSFTFQVFELATSLFESLPEQNRKGPK